MKAFRYPLLTLLLGLTLSTASAQSPLGRFTFHVGAGPTVTTNRLNDYAGNGYNILLGGGVRVTPVVELLGEFHINGSEVRESVLTELAVPDGTATFYSLTGNVKFNLIPRARVVPYVIVGGGWYRRTVEFTEPTTRLVSIIDPWWGYLGNAVVPTNALLGSVTRDSGGLNGGVGFDFRVGESVRVFAESRIHRGYHNPTNTTIIPVTFGVRF
jgi:hypothetical protein